jgi:hypothetical protein
MNQQTLRQIQRALKAGDRLSDEQVVKLAELQRAVNAGNHHVEVRKIALREGEELWDFIDAMWMAVQTNRVILADGSLDAYLQGIFDDHVIVQDGNTGRMFKSTFTRDAKGQFIFGDPVEVRQVFVEVGSAEEDGVEKAAKPEYLEVAKRAASSKFGFLPTSIRRR